MDRYVEISFDCLPLRSVGRFDIPIDASPKYQALCERIKRAGAKHGLYNSYYLHNAKCVYHLTNDAQLGVLVFDFEGTVLTDPDDQHALRCDLQTELHRETCPWLTEPVVRWFAETVSQAVRIEFDRYISVGDLEKTIGRLEQIESESDAHSGFTGMGL